MRQPKHYFQNKIFVYISLCFSERTLMFVRVSLGGLRICYLFLDLAGTEERRLYKTRLEVNFQRGDILRMLTPSSWWHHVASRTWVWQFWRSVQNVSILLPVLELNEDIFLLRWKMSNLGSLDVISDDILDRRDGRILICLKVFFSCTKPINWQHIRARPASKWRATQLQIVNAGVFWILSSPLVPLHFSIYCQ